MRIELLPMHIRQLPVRLVSAGLALSVLAVLMPFGASASISSVEFTDSSGTPLSNFGTGGPLYVQVTDANRNVNTGAIEKVEVSVKATSSGDTEALTVANGLAPTETGNNTGIFLSPSTLPSAPLSGSIAANDGILEIDAIDTITVTYTDTVTENETFDFSDTPLAHTGKEAGHIDDSDAADDPSASSCADAATYAGVQGSADFNLTTGPTYIPTDSADWDIAPSSKAGINDGPTVSNIDASDSTYESNKSLTGGVTNPTGCHGWSIHEFTFDTSPYTNSALSSLDILWQGMATKANDGGELAASNDLFLLAYNVGSDTWDQLDVEADINIEDAAGPPFTNVSLTSTLSSALTNYVTSANKLRLVVTEYSLTANTTVLGGLYTDYVRVNATANDISTDSLGVGGGSILGTVWNDTDRDGTFDSNESGIDGVSVTLLDKDGIAIVTDTTNSNGDYGFLGFPAEVYNLRETDPSGFVSTTSNDLGPLTLASGQVIDNQNFGDAQSLSTTGLPAEFTVWTFAAVFTGGLGLLFFGPRLRSRRGNRSFK